MNLVKTVLVTDFGGFDKLEVKEVPLEQNLTSNDVAVDVYYCGVNFADLYTRQGLIPKKIPFILGIECSGLVTSIGKNVKKFNINDRVICYDYNGGLYRNKVIIREDKCFKIPEEISLKEACVLFVNYLTASICINELCKLKSFQHILIHSCAGGVGWAATQLARLNEGVTVYGTTSLNKANYVKENGVHYVLSYDNYADKIKEMCPKGLNAIIDNQSANNFKINLKLLAPFGSIVVIGANNVISDENVLNSKLLEEMDSNISMPSLIIDSVSVSGLHLGIVAEKCPDVINAIFQEICCLFKSKKISIRVDSLWPLDNIKEATKLLQERRNIGKVLLYTGNINR